MYKRILVAIDGSEQSYKALDHAVAIAKKFGSELTLLAVDPMKIVPFFLDEFFGQLTAKDLIIYQDNMTAIYRDILIDARARVKFGHPDLNVSTILRKGRPSANIINVAEKNGCNMIVIGSRGMGGLKGWMLGSTSHRVAASCKKPVMIIK